MPDELQEIVCSESPRTLLTRVGMPHQLRIVSANLLNGGATPEAFAALVRQLGADIVTVQEIAPNQVALLAAVLPFGKIDAARNSTGMGIASRRPVRMRRLPLPVYDAWAAELHPDDWPELPAPVEIINVHIAAPHHQPFWRTWQRRRAQVQALERHLDGAPERARVLIGDFNSTPLWPLYWRLVSRFTDAARVVARRNGVRLENTWGPGPAARKMLRLDHAFVHGIGVDDFQVEPITGSDHSAIVLDATIE